jgi:tetratricopeptide (TPR) repeat protein
MKQLKNIAGLVLLSSVIALTACEDWFDIRPKSETVFADFWKDESDVLGVVGACYRGMCVPGFIERSIVWGEVRSDNVIAGAGASGEIVNILNLNLNASNSYTYWGEYYSVINYCNTVIKFAPGVQSKDPDFKPESLNSYLAEVKGIRALCYFTLLRAFRDVPLITEPYADDSQPFEKEQEDPAKLLDFLIDDLISIENQAQDVYNNDTYTKGRMTKNAIRALLADMYLWKNDYDNCIIYCDKILDHANGLQLENSRIYNEAVFFTGNSKESIFELQFNANDLPDYAVYEMYGRSGGRAGHSINQLSAFDFSKMSVPLFGATDLRGKDAFYPRATVLPVMKYIALRSESPTGIVSPADYKEIFGANWIFYRLSDVYLMKAEAMVEIGVDLEGALTLVSQTFDRANPDLGANSLQFSLYGTQPAMRDLVLNERQREFIFEGKRYFDLLRHVLREGSPDNMISGYVMKKYDYLVGATVRSKLMNMDAWFMPVNADELRINTLLKQNPYYVTSSNIE